MIGVVATNPFVALACLPLIIPAWSKRQDCMVCQEFCPYQVVTAVKNEGVNCPEVKDWVCRGCGACQNNCPAIPAKAIVVQPYPPKK